MRDLKKVLVFTYNKSFFSLKFTTFDFLQFNLHLKNKYRQWFSTRLAGYDTSEYFINLNNISNNHEFLLIFSDIYFRTNTKNKHYLTLHNVMYNYESNDKNFLELMLYEPFVMQAKDLFVSAVNKRFSEL